MTSSKRRSYILWVELKRFYSEPSHQPQVITRDGWVLDANEAALARGIRCGITVRQAKAMLQGGVFKAWQREDYEERERAWLDLCVDFTGAIEPADQHAAWLDFSLHPNPVDIAEQFIRELTRQTGLAVRFGSAHAKWLACLMAKYSDGNPASWRKASPKKKAEVSLFDSGELDSSQFLALLPVEELLPASAKARERLRFLGYATIGEVAALPKQTLQDQFEEEALLIHAAATGTLVEEVKASYPPHSIVENFIFDGATDSTETISLACDELAERAGERLTLRNEQSGKLHLRVEYEEGEVTNLSRHFTKPLRDPRSVASAICLLIRPALVASVASIRVLIPDLQKVKQFQPSLTFSASNRPPQQQINSALQQVKNVFGDTSLLHASDIELPRRVRVLREWKHATGWR